VHEQCTDQTVLMTNRGYEYVNIPKHWAERISSNGEFIHVNPENTGVQSSSNVTHGCVNLSTANPENTTPPRSSGTLSRSSTAQPR
jgi:hypothetical protein